MWFPHLWWLPDLCIFLIFALCLGFYFLLLPAFTESNTNLATHSCKVLMCKYNLVELSIILSKSHYLSSEQLMHALILSSLDISFLFLDFSLKSFPIDIIPQRISQKLWNWQIQSFLDLMYFVLSRLCLILLMYCQSGFAFPSTIFGLKETDYVRDVLIQSLIRCLQSLLLIVISGYKQKVLV